MTVGQFLQKLPKSVIKDGKVIDIRNSVGENLKVHKSEKQHVQLFAYQVLYSVFLGEKIKWNDTSGMLSHISDFFFLV